MSTDSERIDHAIGRIERAENELLFYVKRIAAERDQLNEKVSQATARLLELEMVLSRTERVLLSLHGHPFPENDQCPAAVVLREITVALTESPSEGEPKA